jgi:DNA-directed RNA polymerase subunit beta
MMVEARARGIQVWRSGEIDFIDVSVKQCISVATALIPFLEHDDANRALMGSNMQRQAVSCVMPQAPIVGTGIEDKAARFRSGTSFADAGEVIEVDANVIVRSKAPTGRRKKHLIANIFCRTFAKSNSFTAMNQVPRVTKGQTVAKGDLLADGASTDHGELALGQNMLVAFSLGRIQL